MISLAVSTLSYRVLSAEAFSHSQKTTHRGKRKKRQNTWLLSQAVKKLVVDW
jgi:hypothetical protein